MARTKIYRSEIAEAMHGMAEGFSRAGLVGKRTMRQFDQNCLAPAPALAPADIKAIREKVAVSQPVFARYLNVSSNLVSEWERGMKRPGGPALRLLAIVGKNGLEAIV